MKDPTEMKKYQPYLLPMNREESARYNGIRQALLGKGAGFDDPYNLGPQYGVVFPEIPPQMPKEKPAPPQPNVQSGVPDDGITDDPNDGGMVAKMAMMGQMPQPGQAQIQASNMLQNPASMAMPQMQPQGMVPGQMQGQMPQGGLQALMARLAARQGGAV